MGCRAKRKLGQAVLTFIIALVMAIIVPRAEAYKFYSLNVDANGNCAQCHGEFRSGTYVSQAEGGISWGVNLHDVHLNNTGVGGNCDNCHGGVDTGTIARRTVNLSSSAAAADGTNAIACSGCHGRLEDAVGNPNTMGTGWGAGLRQHHVRAGAPVDSNGDTCLSCHEDADPAAFTTAGENVAPPWYATFGLAPCNDNLVGAAIGLDNDGDLCYDGDDTDCGGPGCVIVECGNGNVETGEDCDPGAPVAGDCCDDVSCTFESLGTPCDDGNACFDPDTCDDGGGNCIPGPAVDCGDQPDDCVIDVCTPPDTGCEKNNEPAGTACEDGLVCTENDTCDGLGICDAGTAVVCPDDGNVCTTEVCVEPGGCQPTNNTEPCDDGNACTVNDTCGDGSCQPGSLDCNQPGCDGSVDPRCAAGCSGEPDPDAFCQAQDGLFCNGLETCNLSTDQCQAGTPPDCDDGIACTVDSCDEAIDQCVNAPDNAACDDGNICTTDVCDPGLGCQNTPNTAPCDDGDFCTENDVCGGGICAGTPKNCDDGSFCTGVESCNPADGSCVSPGDPCNPGELCNDVTDTCDVITCVDNDNDGYGNPGDPSCPNGAATDCNDANASVNPGAMEVCDGLDTNCDGNKSTTDVDADGDGKAICAGDCDDNDNTVYPGAPEVCDGKDNDCRAGIPLNERDTDGDGFKICDTLSDCNDYDAGTYPGAVEVCSDGKDNNCNGSVDEPGCECPDADGDGFFLAVCADPGPGDCNDGDASIYPGATEICDDGKDNNCDGFPDCQDAACTTVCPCTDADNDGYNINGQVNGYNCGPIDCNDNDPTINPGAKDICDGKDNNCDGYVKSTDVDNDGDGQPICAGDCNDNDITVYKGAPEICDGKDNDCRSGIPVNERDSDGDGVKACDVPGDCNDYDASTYPDAPEICSDNRDNNCNGLKDETPCICPDGDGDGFKLALCEADPALADCNDADATIYPGAQEVCADGIDNNCNARVDCADADCGLDTDCQACIAADGDGDGYSTLGGICGPVDCNDGDPAIYPGAKEICDGKDNNCDGVQSSTDVDADGDGKAVCAGDCNDNDATIYPGAPELCDGKDNDCRSGVPAVERDNDGDGVRLCDVPPDCNNYDATMYPGNTEVCADGKDNDCDGMVDEPDCAGGCVPTGTDDNCNGVDEDCIGGADDGYVPMSTSCGTGVCAAVGFTSCLNGSVQDSCTPGPESGISETICNGDDDDCDGAADEDYVMDSSCGLGVCGAPNNTPSSCVGGVETACQEGSPTETSEVTCGDGLDNDCDGLTDSADPDCPVANCSTYTTKQTCNDDTNCKWNKNTGICENR